MAEIKVKDKIILIDDKNFGLINHWKWQVARNGYATRTIYKNGRFTKLYLHTLILEPKEGFEADHINGNKLDNRITNLRYATASQNHSNSKVYKSNRSGFKGVGFHKGKIRSYIQVDNKHIHLGYFNNVVEAAKIYNRNAMKYFGEFAKLNMIGGQNG